MSKWYQNDIAARKFLKRWYSLHNISEDPTNVYRIHVSHTDMDGYGCFVVATAVESGRYWLDPNVAGIGYNSQVTAQTPKDVAEVLNKEIKYLTELKGYNKGEDTLEILVTDLRPPIDTFNNLIDDGHLINYCVIDHHQFHNADDEFYRLRYEDSGAYYITTEMSATLILAFLSTADTINNTGLADRIISFAASVSKYDTGNWGNWDVEDLGHVPYEVKLQLSFASASKKANSGDLDSKVALIQWVCDMVKGLMSDVDPIEPYHAEVSEAWKDLIHNNAIYENLMMDMSIPTVPAFQFPMPKSDGTLSDFKHNIMIPNYKVMGVVIPKGQESIRYFSMIAKNILDAEHENIDILVYVDFNRGTVELRSWVGGDVDVSKIAFHNGGGGHMRASGFPIFRKKEA